MTGVKFLRKNLLMRNFVIYSVLMIPMLCITLPLTDIKTGMINYWASE